MSRTRVGSQGNGGIDTALRETRGRILYGECSIFFAMTFLNFINHHFQSYHFIVINRRGCRHERIVLGRIGARTASAGTIASAGNGGDGT